MSSDPLPPDSEEQFSPAPLGPPPGLPDESFTEVIPPVLPIYRRERPILAWIVIVFIVVLLIAMRMVHPDDLKAGSAKGAAKGAVPRETAAEAQGEDMSDLQDRFLIGTHQLSKQTGVKIDDQLPDPNTLSLTGRLRFAVVLGEIKGPAKALGLLEATAPKDPNDLELRDILERLYRQYDKGDFSRSDISTADEKLLKARLGWLGELALHPQGAADQSVRNALLEQAVNVVVGTILFAFCFFVAGFIGLVSLFLLIGKVVRGQLSSKLEPPIVNGSVYAETFALWLVGFIIFSLVVGVVLELLPRLPQPIKILSFGSPLILAHLALLWPLARRVPWSQLRREIGLTTDAGILPEVFAGIRCYLTALPLVAIGLIITVLLMRLDTRVTGNQPAPPTHPVVEMLAHPSPADLACLFVVLSVIAPLCEETAFRGVLYRHLREASWGWRTGLSIFFSATISSFIFAAIHPQGAFGVPLLMALAYAFCGARELRGSLIPSMVAHGINNGVVLLVVTFVIGT
jgi:membrane protease YdiL (CAAX protease family)